MKRINHLLTGLIFTTLLLSACGPTTDPNSAASQITPQLKERLRKISGVVDLIEPPKSPCMISILIDPKTPNQPVQDEANLVTPKNVSVCVHTSR